MALLLLCLTNRLSAEDQSHARALLELAQQQASRITNVKHIPTAECYAYGQLGDTQAAMLLWEQVDLPEKLWLVCETARGLAEAGYVDQADAMLQPLSKINTPVMGKLGYLEVDLKSKALASLVIAQLIKGQPDKAQENYWKISHISDQCFALSRIVGYLADHDQLEEAQQWYARFDDGRWRTYATQKLVACYTRKHGFDKAYAYARTFKDSVEVKESQWQIIKMQIIDGQLDQAIVNALAGFDNRKMQRELREIAREFIDADNVDLGLKVLNKLPEPVRWRTSLRERTAMAYVRSGDLKMAYQMVLSVGSSSRSQFFANLKICDQAAQIDKPDVAKQYYDAAIKSLEMLQNERNLDVFYECLTVSRAKLGLHELALTDLYKAGNNQRLKRAVADIGAYLVARDQMDTFKKYLEKLDQPADQVAVLLIVAQSQLNPILLVEH
jgi:hypothetical protein